MINCLPRGYSFVFTKRRYSRTSKDNEQVKADNDPGRIKHYKIKCDVLSNSSHNIDR